MDTKYHNLKLLMDSTALNEIKCGEYLEYTKEKLVDCSPDTFLRFEKEYRLNSGDIDLVITCETENDAGIKYIEAYIWEIKAPQCHIFERDNNQRVKPTKDLISAENQLLHYYEECKKSDVFKNEFQITDVNNIHIGGIIIGQKSTCVKDSSNKIYGEEKKKSLFTKAISCRTNHFYKNSGINFLTWDRILDLLRSDKILELDNKLIIDNIPIKTKTYEFNLTKNNKNK